MEKTAAQVELIDRNACRRVERTVLALGNPGNPMSWEDLERKFLSLAEPDLQENAMNLFGSLAQFDRLTEVGRITE
jgi:2-methylcitrate dehydratase PrpD